MTNPPFRTDPAIEKRVKDRLRSYELAAALAQAMGGGKPNAPVDDLGFVSPYRAQAMARIAENEDRQFRNHTNTVPGENRWMSSPVEKARVDTDRARVNAYSLMEALKALQEQESAKKRGTPRWR